MKAAASFTAGGTTYEWAGQWTVPDATEGQDNRRTHGVVCSPSTGNVVVFHQAKPAVLVFSPQGKLLAKWGDRYLGAHGLSLAVVDGEERVWLTDQNSAEVAEFTLDGKPRRTIAKPDHPAYAKGERYSPTWVAVNAKNGDVWVADGYGQSIVHRHDKTGKRIGAIDGTEAGALGRFSCPHGIGFNTKGELVVADRGNKRLQIYDGAGKFLRGVTDLFHSPCSFDFHQDLMLVPELRTGVKLVRGDRELLADLGENVKVSSVQGWPNLADTEHVAAGAFNSPHGACFTRDGDIMCVEWIIGGRITRLARKK
jgi:DNA-binding beta-propeller fold protein YncE